MTEFTVFPQSLVWPSPTVGWVYTFLGPLYLPRLQTWDSFLVDHLDAPWANFVLRDMRMDLTFLPFPSRLLRRPWTSILVGSFLGLGLFPQPRVRVSLGSYPKGFAFGLGLVPQSVVASSPSSLGSLASWLWAIALFIFESLSWAFILAPNCCREVRQRNIKWLFVIISEDD